MSLQIPRECLKLIASTLHRSALDHARKFNFSNNVHVTSINKVYNIVTLERFCTM